ncbi:flagellar protein FlgN [Neobacillus notoginsengisoli]|uniref:Flagellar protein FlgN n=1 Tax=Neobacillus notoginsengisoli TaxID=1578198 RepID=A0A417YJK3_9BACI|nr:flagellar protein FlgN [Neobacillus notoginsengisoli]RHW33326.1 flagellar protein FlgN [Neobacillus notoginsengisoli]
MNRLLEVLQLLADLHKQLLEIAKKKQEILISGDINLLLPLISEESKLLKKIKQAEEERTRAIGEDVNQSFTRLIEQQPEGDLKEKMKSILGILQQRFEEIGRVNHLNQQLLEQSLTYTQYMINQILPASEGSGLYSAGANPKEMNESVRLFDAKA